MNIQPLPPASDLAPTAAVERVAPGAAGVVGGASATSGAAATFWFSPPGQYLSILHRLGSLYPVELVTALRAFAEAVPAVADPTARLDASTVVALATEGAPPPAAARRRVATGPVGYAPTAPPPAGSPDVRDAADAVPALSRLLATMTELAQQRPDAFRSVAASLAASLQSVSTTVTRDGAPAMATLAAQLFQATQVAMGDPNARPVEAKDDLDAPSPVASVGRVLRDEQGPG